jgi:hypothetical protein
MKHIVYTALALSLIMIPASCKEKTAPQKEAAPMMMPAMETVIIKKVIQK